jgi:hypothetical protein
MFYSPTNSKSFHLFIFFVKLKATAASEMAAVYREVKPLFRGLSAETA